MFLSWFRSDLEERDLIIKHTLAEGQFSPDDLDDLLIYFDGLLDRIEAEIARESWHIACHDEAARLNGIELRAVWNALGDLREGVYAKYVAIASGELAVLGYVDFPEKLETMVTSFASSEFDYRDSEWVSDEQLVEARSGICKSMAHERSSQSDRLPIVTRRPLPATLTMGRKPRVAVLDTEWTGLMPKYCVNTAALPTGEHIVHRLEAPCSVLPDTGDRIDLGTLADDLAAVREATRRFKKADGCPECMVELEQLETANATDAAVAAVITVTNM